MRKRSAEMARLVSEGRKKEFAAFVWDPASIPDPEKKETFERSKQKLGEVLEGRHAEMLAWYFEMREVVFRAGFTERFSAAAIACGQSRAPAAEEAADTTHASSPHPNKTETRTTASGSTSFFFHPEGGFSLVKGLMA